MNVRLAPHEVRFRVTRDELEHLLSGRSLALRVALTGHHEFQASVIAQKVGAWRLDSDPTGLWLTLPKGELETLAGAVPTAAGLMHDFELPQGQALQLTFEVDVRS
jgi:hypothetical protein